MKPIIAAELVTDSKGDVEGMGLETPHALPVLQAFQSLILVHGKILSRESLVYVAVGGAADVRSSLTRRLQHEARV
jgi:hypothetical protein